MTKTSKASEIDASSLENALAASFNEFSGSKICSVTQPPSLYSFSPILNSRKLMCRFLFNYFEFNVQDRVASVRFNYNTCNYIRKIEKYPVRGTFNDLKVAR